MLRIVAVLCLIAAILLGLRLSDLQSFGTADEAPLSTPGNSDYYITDAVVYQMDSSGRLAYRMRLAETLHFPDDSARLSDIDVHYLAGTQTYWDITAARGRIPPDGHDIYLYDGVEGRHPRPNGPVVRVATDNAWVRPDADRIDTAAHVKATQPGQSIEGDGMEIDLNTDELRLLNNVQVTYTP